MNDYSKITALYSRLSVGDEDRDGGESGRFFDRSAYSRMIEDVENPFPPPTGTSRPKRRNGGRHGRGFAIRHWSSTDTRSA